VDRLRAAARLGPSTPGEPDRYRHRDSRSDLEPHGISAYAAEDKVGTLDPAVGSRSVRQRPRGESMVVMGQLSAPRSRIVVRAIVVLSAFVAAGTGSAHGANGIAATGCTPKPGAVVRTLRVGVAHTQTVRAHVGDTIKVIADMKGYHQVKPPEPLDHKHAVCRISMRRASKSEVIAKFRARRASKEKITFGSTGVTSSKGCPPDSHGCPHPVLWIGYVRIQSSARPFTG